MQFPWLIKTWGQLITYKKNNLIPSGLLLSGPAGIGKTIFAKEYAQFILCQDKGEAACQKCRSCILFNAGNHPDYFFIEGEEKSAIKIDQMRELIESLGQTPAMSGYQVAVVSLAEDMNKASANALLKTLEEPRGNVLILLLSNRPSAIAATVRSRCQHIKLPIPTKAEATTWLLNHIDHEGTAASYLAIADNLPMKALTYAKDESQQLCDLLITQLQQVQKGILDPISASALSLTTPFERLQFLITLTMDMIRLKLSSKVFLNHQSKLATLMELGRNISLDKLFQFLDHILEATRLLNNRSNVNLQLLMEKLFINWRYNNEIS